VLCKRGSQDIHPAKVGNDGTDNHRGMKNCSDVMVGVVIDRGRTRCGEDKLRRFVGQHCSNSGNGL
jgi:hypothetical protein